MISNAIHWIRKLPVMLDIRFRTMAGAVDYWMYNAFK